MPFRSPRTEALPEPMNPYLLSVHSTSENDCPTAAQAPPDPEAMQAMMARIEALEKDMRAGGAWMFSARLTPAHDATVVRSEGDQLLTTDGPFAEAKEQIAGFYIIQAKDLDAALAWAGKVTECVGKPIEVRPFAGFQS